MELDAMEEEEINDEPAEKWRWKTRTMRRIEE
jgi:hypothetical protein